MAHARGQLRAAVVALLTPTYTVTPGRVYPEGSPLPALTVFVDSEETEQESDEVMGSADQIRRLELLIEIRAEDTTDLDAALDALCLAVEKLIAADSTLGNLAEWSTIAGTEYDRSKDGEKPIGLATMTYQIEYRTDRTDPELIRP